MCDRLIVSAGCRPAAAAAVTRSGRAVIVLIDTFRLWTTVQLRQDGPALWAISWGCWHQGRLTHKLWSSGTLIVLISTDQNRGYIWPVEMFCPACCSGLWTRVIGSCLQDYLWLNHFSLPAGRRKSSWRQNEFAAVCSARCVFVFQPPSCLSSLHTDCLGLRFTWLHSLLDNFPSLVSFALKLRCATGLCPRDLEDYGCSCRYVAVGDPVDPLDLWVQTLSRKWLLN